VGTPDRTVSLGMQRVAAASGIGFVVLVVASLFAAPNDLPTYSDSAQDFAAFYTDEESALQVASVLSALALFEFAWFIGYLRGVLGMAETAARGFVRMAIVAFAGGISGLALAAGGHVLTVAAVNVPEDTELSVIRTLDLAADIAYTHASVLFGAFLLASAFVVMLTRVLPVWLAWLGVFGSALSIAQLGILLQPEKDEGFVGFLGFAFNVVFLAWVLATSIELLRQLGRESSTTRTG
jgi:hypothetical protein